MSRVQLAINVTDIDKAVDFYSKLLATEPAKRKPGYANFAIADPPLKLVLFEGPEGATLNHLGVETEDRPRSRRPRPGCRPPVSRPRASTTRSAATPPRWRRG